MQGDLKSARATRDRVIRGDVMIGILSPAEVDEMVQRYRRAGDAQGFIELGALYSSDLMTVVPDHRAAVECYSRAIEAGGGVGAHELRLRTAYFHAKDQLSDEQIADDLHALQASPTPDRLTLLGHCTYAGFGQPSDPAAAARFHQAAADLGSSDSMFELYVFHAQGIGVEVDAELASQWLQRAADAGNERAMYNLAAMFATGRGVSRDPDASVQWYERAAAAGHGRAAATLAFMLLTGQGAERNRERAEQMHTRAAELGFPVDAFFTQLGVSL